MFFLKFVFSKQLKINIKMELICIASGQNNNRMREREKLTAIFCAEFPFMVGFSFNALSIYGLL